jgi:hypothetical protein
VEGRNPDGHINAASTSEIDINPYVTSEDLGEIPFVESKSSPPAGKGIDLYWCVHQIIKRFILFYA